jgi:hypothetical protein
MIHLSDRRHNRANVQIPVDRGQDRDTPRIRTRRSPEGGGA